MKRFLPYFTFAIATLAAEGQNKNQLQKALFAEEVEQDASKAAAIYQSMIDDSEESPRYLAMARFRLARIHQQDGRKAEATALLKTLASDPNAPADWVVQAERLLATAAQDGKHPEQAGGTTLFEEIKDKLWYWHSGHGKPFGTLRFLPEGNLETTVGVDWLVGWAQVDKRRVRITNQNGSFWVIEFSEDGKKTVGAAAPGVVDTFKFLGAHPTPSMSIDEAEIEYLRDLLSRRPDAMSQWGIPCKLAKRNRLKAITFLLDHGVRADLRNIGGNNRTPLMEAVAGSHLQMAKLLLARGADVNALNSRNASPLHFAANQADMDLIRLLVGSGANLEQNSGWIVAENRGDDIGTPLHAAIEAGNTPAVRVLLELGANINAVTPTKSHSVLNRAIGKEDFELSLLLLENGADPNIPLDGPVHPLTQAAYSGNIECVRMLIEKGARLNARSSQVLNTFGIPRSVGSPLHAAVREGNVKIAALLVDSGSPIDLQAPRFHETPLHAAALHGNTAMSRWLLEKGANLHSRLSDPAGFQAGWQPLHSAAWGGSLEVVRLLMEKGASPLETSSDAPWKRTPLHLAVLKGNLSASRLMMDQVKGNGRESLADLLAQSDLNGNTALHLSVSREAKPNAELVRLLIDSGASQAAVNLRNQTARQLCLDPETGSKDPAVREIIAK